MKTVFFTLIAVVFTTITLAQDSDNCGGSTNTQEIKPE
jgi:hypothetical protein